LFISELVLVLDLNTDSSATPDYSQTITFTSPVFQLFGPACLDVSFLVNAYFEISIIYQQHFSIHELVLYRSSQNIYMTPMLISVPYIEADNQEFVLALESQVYFAGSVAIFDYVNLSQGTCSATGKQCRFIFSEHV